MLKIAVLIPAYNEELVIATTIAALFATGFDQKNIFVADDASTDKTADVCRSFGVNVFTSNQNGGKARSQLAAINYFDLTFKYDWIIFLDGDTKVDHNFRAVMLKAAMDNPSISLFVGQVVSDKNDHIFSAMRAYDYTLGQEICKKGQDNFNLVYVSPGCASMYSTKMLKSLDIDPSTLAEDMDLTIQVHRKNGKVKYLHDAMVITQDPSNLIDYHKQIMRWSRGVWQVIVKHGVFDLFNQKQRVDWYMMYVAIESLLLNKVFLLIMLATMFSLQATGICVLVDWAVYSLIGIFAAYRTKRVDVFYKTPIFYWLSYLNLYAFLRSFVEIILLRKEMLIWNKVKRYSFVRSV